MKRSLSVLAALAVAAATLVPQAAAQPGPVTDPLPAPAPSGTGVRLQEIARLPQSSTTPEAGDSRLKQYNRINYLGEVPDGSGRFFVPDMNGRLYTLGRDGSGQRTYLDVRTTIGANFHNHQGLGSGFGFVAFHPKFATNGKFYTAHTEAKDALKNRKPDLPSPNSVVHGVITEWTASNPRAATFSGTRRELLRVGFAQYLHGFQEIGFGPDELLYLAVGDGGIGYRSDVPQDVTVPQGKILRIDPAGTNSGNGKYGIPPSNPFLGRPGALAELYAIGMRDPYRFSWDTGGTRKMLLGHIGEKVVESVYEVKPGANLGWGQREGHLTYRRNDPKCQLYPLPADDAKYGYTYPVAGFDHNRPGGGCGDSGNALIGGFVYRGSAIPALQGKYVYGEGVKGLLYYADERDMRAGAPIARTFELAVYDSAGRRTTMQSLAGKSRVDLRFGTDAAGELYVLAKANGKIWKVTGTVQTAQACAAGGDVVSDVTRAADWKPVTPLRWRFPGTEVVLSKAGGVRPGPRRPNEYAVVTKGPSFGNVVVDAQVRLDTPVTQKERDVVIVFGYQSDTRFYYAHLSSDNKIYPHNGIFLVDNADRVRIDDQWNGSVGAAPAISDMKWHHVRVTHCADTGAIAVHVDGSSQPLMTATNTVVRSGRVGFGSFDNIGRVADLRISGQAVSAQAASEVSPGIAASVVNRYDFEHPAADAKKEDDLGRPDSRTPITLVNGGAAMRVQDGAFPGSQTSLQVRQVRPGVKGNDDWKAGVYGSSGVASMKAFGKARGMSIMTWVKITGEAPARSTSGLYSAIGFAGVLSGDSDGHAARALLEAENHDGAMRLIALGRRLDGGDKQFFVAKADWRTLLPPGKWVFLAGTFDFDNGTIGLYVDGRPVEGSYAVSGDPWKIVGGAEPDVTSAAAPRGVKIGGSHPQNNREANACNCRLDGLMFLDRAVTSDEVRAQYDWVRGL
ncbi:PQQ-dependent sugar dehydrogenase [Lentzea sp. NPDC058450]|uniref:PQQ-dependent sugar dehydrogenase n=1 Tax=Lentzea sp. NPDC058450 TaxID=3346505 RepID=UPI003659FB2F